LIEYIPSIGLQKLPYVATKPNNDQVVYSYPYFVENEKQFYDQVPDKNNVFNFLYIEDMECFYYSKSKVNIEKDVFIDLFNVLICGYSYNFIATYIEAIDADVLNLSAVFEKYFILLNYLSAKPDDMKTILISTEIEYFFGVIRSIYDLLEKIIHLIAKKYCRIDLPFNSYADIFKKDTHEVLNKWPNMPRQLHNYYTSSADLFFECRDIRNHIHHYGVTKNFIFHFDEGFGIHPDLFNFSKFNIWSQDKVKENNIVSLLALFAYVTKAVIQNMNDLSLVFLDVFRPQNPFISNDYRIFLRGSCTEHLNKLDKYLDEQWIMQR
jgi:hypothetical protein